MSGLGTGTGHASFVLVNGRTPYNWGLVVNSKIPGFVHQGEID
jgi:hypothetical protein